ncbi:MAG: pyruvate dehydrogenase (acetyl-transferring), homodimeric type [Enterobacterales bacterium]
MSYNLHDDIDKYETSDWLNSIESVINKDGTERAHFLLIKILNKAYKLGVKKIFSSSVLHYVNSIHSDDEFNYPGNLNIEKKIRNIINWNAIIMVIRASKKNLDLGGHISSFQSFSTIYDVCFNHFFKAYNKNDGGDLIYFQGHSAPGIYARSFIEGRITEEQMNNFRQETNCYGLPSYPHPKLMPEFWQFPTVSMGLGPISAIYQAKFLKYLHNRRLKNTNNQTVYAFIGDGEMDEPESKGAISIAASEKLDNLIFIVNCNLQRLDGPVSGNRKIIFDLENQFLGAGWEVIKVIWGDKWDNLLNKDTSGKLLKLLDETVDGDYQKFTATNGAYIRKHFFGKYYETKCLVKNMNDNDIWSLNRGGHDYKKIYSALKKATNTLGKPVIILVHTIKGYGMGKIAEGMNISHQIKQMSINDLYYFRDRFNLNQISDNQIKSLSYIKLNKNSEEYNYLHKCRKKLYGYVPYRLKNFTNSIELPKLKNFISLLEKQTKKISTTTAFIRILNILLKDNYIKDKLVPIISDEARTFGMSNLFYTLGVYNGNGQKYVPQDYGKIIYYREDKKGQILQEGINELGAAASWLAAATSYSTNNFPMIPFYIFYSMFGFQRIGDLLWAAGDQQARGFLIGGTSGRTTLNGEGLQHADGHSQIQSLTIPNCISYDPSYAYELAIIIHDGLHRMYGYNQENIYYYITITNENYSMPNMPNDSEEGIKKGIYKLETLQGYKCKVQLLGSGSILKYIRKAARILSKEYNISSDVYSVTSFTELARDGQNCDRWNMLNPTETPKIPYISKVMNESPAVAATDYIKLFSEQIRKFIPSKHFYVLGTDGFGRSDSRKNLRNYFEVNDSFIIVAVLHMLSKCGFFNKNIVKKTINKLNINPNKINPILI